MICDLSKLDEKGCHGAPDWIIEVVSPSSKRMDYFRKLFKYNSAGVREYWIVDPIKELVTVYNFEQETMEQGQFRLSLFHIITYHFQTVVLNCIQTPVPRAKNEEKTGKEIQKFFSLPLCFPAYYYKMNVKW